MPIQRSTKCARCGHPKSDVASFNRRGEFADGTPRLSALCKPCFRADESTPRRREQKRAFNDRKRREMGTPVRKRGAAEFCPQGHLKADNLRPGRYDCAVCHRNMEEVKRRSQGVKPVPRLGEAWKCGHDSTKIMRYAKGRPKGCAQCHRERQRLVPYKPEKRRLYVEKNREKINAYHRAWRAANRPDIVEFKKGGPESLEYAQMIDSDPCVYCGGKSSAIDHIRPVAKGGMGNWDNLAPICTGCNSSKHSKDVLHFLIRRLNRSGVTS